MKKSITLILCLLSCLSLFAGPSPGAVSEMVTQVLGVLAHAILFFILFLCIAYNVSNPKRERTKVLSVLLAIFMVIFGFFFFNKEMLFYDGKMYASPAVLAIDLLYLFFILLDIFFLVVAFRRIKNQQNLQK